MKRSHLYLVIGSLVMIGGMSLSWFSVNAFWDASPTILGEYDGSMDFYDYVMQNHSSFIYLILVGILIGIIGFSSLIAGIVFLVRDRNKDKDQLYQEKQQRVEREKKTDFEKYSKYLKHLAWGLILGGILILSSVLYYGILPSKIGFIVVQEDYTGVLDVAGFVHASLLFIIGYLILKPNKYSEKAVIVLFLIKVTISFGYLIQGHNYAFMAPASFIFYLYLMRKIKSPVSKIT